MEFQKIETISEESFMLLALSAQKKTEEMNAQGYELTSIGTSASSRATFDAILVFTKVEAK